MAGFNGVIHSDSLNGFLSFSPDQRLDYYWCWREFGKKGISCIAVEASSPVVTGLLHYLKLSLASGSLATDYMLWKCGWAISSGDRNFTGRIRSNFLEYMARKLPFREAWLWL